MSPAASMFVWLHGGPDVLQGPGMASHAAISDHIRAAGTPAYPSCKGRCHATVDQEHHGGALADRLHLIHDAGTAARHPSAQWPAQNQTGHEQLHWNCHASDLHEHGHRRGGWQEGLQRRTRQATNSNTGTVMLARKHGHRCGGGQAGLQRRTWEGCRCHMDGNHPGRSSGEHCVDGDQTRPATRKVGPRRLPRGAPRAR